MRVILALAVLILGSTGGEIAITHGMKATGEPTRLRPMALLQFLGRAVSNGRSEERRVGKECRSRWSPYRQEKKKASHEQGGGLSAHPLKGDTEPTTVRCSRSP